MDCRSFLIKSRSCTRVTRCGWETWSYASKSAHGEPQGKGIGFMRLSIVRLWSAHAALSGPGGKLGVVVAAVVVVIAIAAVIVMVLRNNGGGKKVARGIGY